MLRHVKKQAQSCQKTQKQHKGCQPAPSQVQLQQMISEKGLREQYLVCELFVHFISFQSKACVFYVVYVFGGFFNKNNNPQLRGHLSPHQARPMSSSGTEEAAAVRCPPWLSISSSGTEAAVPSTSPQPSTHYSTVSDAASPSILPDLSVRLRANPAPSQLHVNNQLILLKWPHTYH